jgi:hypothetical protein
MVRKDSIKQSLLSHKLRGLEDCNVDNAEYLFTVV